MMGTLYAVHTGNMLIHLASCKGYVEWCVKHSGRGPAQIPLKKILASLREGKVRVGDDNFMLSTMVAKPGSIYWVPAGWLVARKADNLCSVALRKSFVVMASYSMEELSAHVSLQPVAEARGIQEREILKEIVHARLPAPKALEDQQVEKKPESQNTPSPPGALPPAVPPLAELAEQEQAGASQATAPGQPEQAELRAVAAPSPGSPASVELAEVAWAALAAAEDLAGAVAAESAEAEAANEAPEATVAKGKSKAKAKAKPKAKADAGADLLKLLASKK